MSLADLIAQRKAAAGLGEVPHQPSLPSGEPGAGCSPENEASGVPETGSGDPAPEVPLDEPYGVAQAVTPSGLEIYYQAGPKRLYRIFDVNKHDWIEVPSVSTILEVLEKGGLSWWGMKVGIEGVRELARMNVLVPADFELDQLDGSDPDAWTTDAIVRSMTEHKLTVNYTKDKAATRGTNVHTALETWAETGVIPDPQFFPENERGYVEGLGAFLRDATPLPHHTELMVASTAGFAGRFDMVASISGNIVTKTYPKKAPIRKQLSGRWLLDLKTSKGVYPSYKLQLGAYRGGLVECGYEDVDHAGVVRVTPEGKYELVESHATLEDFLQILAAKRVVDRQ